MSNNGYIYVASRNKLYYELSLQAVESLKTFYPECNVTLFTHDAWVEDRATKLFDNIVTDIPIHSRAKMWCMARTPYDVTFYNDVDSQIVHPNIKNAFRDLEESDMFFTNSFWYTTANYKWAYIDKKQTIKVRYHGAVCCYRKNDLTIDFHQTWFEEYLKQQRAKEWVYDFAHEEWKNFDMFTLWRMTDGNYEEFERFKKLDIAQGPKIYCATVQDNPKEYTRKNPAVNIQMDRNFYSKLHTWNIIEKGERDERNLPERPKVGEYSLKYN